MGDTGQAITVAIGSSLGWLGGFGGALLAYSNDLPSAVTGGAFFVGLAGVCTALTPLVVKVIEARRLTEEIAELRDEVIGLKSTVKDMAAAISVDRRWMIEAAIRYPELKLPVGFGERSFDPKPSTAEMAAMPAPPPPPAGAFDDPDRRD